MKKSLSLFLLVLTGALAFSQPPQDWEGKVMTVKGLIPPDSMGITLPHEHLLIVHKFNYLDLTDESAAIEELGYFTAAGGKTVCDASAIGIGRNPEGLKRISNATGLNVIMCTGYYKDQWIHDTLKSKSVEALTDIMIHDIVDGINGIHAGFIKIGISKPITAFEEKAVVAAARAQIVTGVAIELHFDGDRATLAERSHVLDVLESEGVDLRRVIVNHNVPYTYLVNDVITMAERGCYVAFDMIGLEVRVLFLDELKLKETLNALIAAGYLDHLLLSQDVCFSVCYVRNGGYGYGHILNDILPELKASGITDAQIHTMMVENPEKIFPFKSTGFCVNETFTAESGTVADNSGSRDYYPQMDCQKLIAVPDASAIELQFTSFQTEAGYDFVSVYDGATTLAPLLGRFSGTTLPQKLTSSSGDMLISFTTDGATEAAGWSASYIARILKSEVENLTVEPEAGSDTVRIHSTVNWSANENSAWLNVSKLNDSTLAILFQKNKLLNSRAADIHITGEGVGPIVLSVLQKESDAFLSITPSSDTVPSEAGSMMVKVLTNANWTASTYSLWLLPVKLNDSILSVSFLKNPDIYLRSYQIIIGEPSVIVDKIRIYQRGADPFLNFESQSSLVNADSGNISLKITSNFNWKTGETPAFLRAIKANDTTLTIQYTENVSIDGRSATIFVGDSTIMSGTINFSQNGAIPMLKVDMDTIHVNADFGITSVGVNSNMEWTVYEDANWISALKSNDTTILIVHNINSSAEQRKYTVIVEGSNEMTEYITVLQDGSVISGSDPVSEKQEFMVFPNPFTHQLKFNIPPGTTDFIEIYDSRGALVMKIKNTDASGQMIIDFTGMDEGIYMYRVIGSSGAVYSGKVVKEP